MAINNTHFGTFAIRKMLINCKKIFFIGIGGVSMSSLAQLTKRAGYEVEGSDRTAGDATEKLAASGIKVHIGHSAENVNFADAVVYTVAISADNPEYVAAKEAGIPLISRADYLGYIMTSYPERIGIAGMHGKSTCTSMCASVFMDGGFDPTVVSGADYPKMGGFYRIGNRDDFIFEACEYMDSFLDFSPTTAVILNVELEHVDYFKTLENIKNSFRKFAELTGPDGTVVYCADDDNAVSVLENYGGRKIPYGMTDGCEFTAENVKIIGGRPSFDIFHNGGYFCHVDLKVPGEHNILNSLATAAVAFSRGVSPDAVSKGLSDFTGARRRMEYKGEINGAEIYDDYGHHPTEILSTLRGAKQMLGETGRLFCVFQPHTYSRTAALIDDFASSLGTADRVILVPIYAARETDTMGVSSELIAGLIGKEKATACQSIDQIIPALKEELKKDDLCIIMGAGDIENIFIKLN